jgi:hypothetical protein
MPENGGGVPWPVWAFVTVAVAVIGAGATIFSTRQTTPPTPTPISQQPPPPVAPPPSNTSAVAGPFAGSWINVDPNTRDITRLAITQNGRSLTVHAWGKCSPEDCDWKLQDGIVTADRGRVVWDQGFVVRTMTISLQGADRLVAVTQSVFNDSRGTRQNTDTFARQ